MTGDFDPEQFLNETGIDVRLGEPQSEPPLSSVGQRSQADLLQHLERMRASIEMLEATIRDRPSDDRAFDAINAAFGQNLEAARAALLRFYERRDCAGVA